MTTPTDVQLVHDILCDTDWRLNNITPELFQAQRIVRALQAMQGDALAAGRRFRAAYEAVDQDPNEETEQELLDAIDNFDKVTR